MTKVTLESPREEIVKAWVEALRSGEYEQAYGRLYDGKSYCCLGVLCKVVGIRPNQRKDFGYYFSGANTVLPERVHRAIGLRTNNGECRPIGRRSLALSAINDDGKPFSEIADLIESRPPGLFVED